MPLLEQADERIIAVRHAPVNPWPKRIALVATVLVLGLSGFLFALFQTETWYGDLEAERDLLARNLKNEQAISQGLRRELATIKTGALVDRQAASTVRAELRDYQKTIDKLKESIQFYENLMNPKAGQAGLDAYKFVVYPTDEAGVYRFRLVMQQLGTGQRSLSAQASVELVGLLHDEETTVALEEMLIEPADWPDKFSFRYYYNVEGKLRLPEGFDPRQINVSLKAPKTSLKQFEFNWQVQVMEN